MVKIVLYSTKDTDEAIRWQAAKKGISVNAYLLFFVNAIADGRCV
ncbi:hypothetical protein [Hymenobacter sp. GOD-10R]|nr:hypothetical protein [Hymenobacter sp. GOD-10R]WRQ27089.1 hypothetical protein SD425_18610 [Hymenobacter sp. GOD-10R]